APVERSRRSRLALARIDVAQMAAHAADRRIAEMTRQVAERLDVQLDVGIGEDHDVARCLPEQGIHTDALSLPPCADDALDLARVAQDHVGRTVGRAVAVDKDLDAGPAPADGE